MTKVRCDLCGDLMPRCNIVHKYGQVLCMECAQTHAFCAREDCWKLACLGGRWAPYCSAECHEQVGKALETGHPA